MKITLKKSSTLEELEKYLSDGQGANSIIEGSPLLHLFSSDIECAKKLVRAGANPKSLNADGKNALEYYLLKEYDFLSTSLSSYITGVKSYEHLIPIVGNLLALGVQPTNSLMDITADGLPKLFILFESYSVAPSVVALKKIIRNCDRELLPLVTKYLSLEEIVSYCDKLQEVTAFTPYIAPKKEFIKNYVEPIIQKKMLDIGVPACEYRKVNKL